MATKKAQSKNPKATSKVTVKKSTAPTKKKTAPAKKTTVPTKKKTAEEILKTIRRKSQIVKNKKQSVTVVAAKPVKLSPENEARMAEWQERKDDENAFIDMWGRKLEITRRRMSDINRQYNKLLYKNLQDAYEIYDNVMRSQYVDDFFLKLRFFLKERKYKIQSNTTDAALLIRYICDPSVSNKTIHDYSRAIEGGYHDSVDADKFADWLERKTLTKVLEEYKAVKREIETPAERLDRARRVVLRMLEIRETMPYIKFTRIEHDAERMIGSNFGLCVMLGYAYRTFGRGGDGMNVDINLNFLLPPTLDLEITIVDKLARYLISEVERYEKELDEKEEEIWANDIWERLVANCNEEVEKRNEYWANRHQAALAEDQYEFAKQIKEKKRLKNRVKHHKLNK
jgi:hypothetical protein